MRKLGLFEGFGVELEYMITDATSLKVLPVADEVLRAFEGKGYVSDIDNGAISWSNELAMHVIELKTNGPAAALENLSDAFSENIKIINEILDASGGVLLPTAMHPFMDPFQEMKIWPHETNEVYEKYHQIFDCRGHGWANLQSVHINLPFANDEEFGRLHAAIRLILPILPALAASSPFMDGKYTGFKDTRLQVYQQNQHKIPSIAGDVIPEAVFTTADYHEKILQKLYKDIAPYDKEGILQHEWLNSRGATVRFERNTIEIRVLDIQECPLSDIAILSLIVATLKNLVSEKHSTLKKQQDWHEKELYHIFNGVIKNGEDALITNERYLNIFGIKEHKLTARELWLHLYKNAELSNHEICKALEVILTQGTLSTRILNKLKTNFSHQDMVLVYRELVQCLKENRPLSS